ncbi:S8 family serine peptidase [Lonepinella sp. BR2474]|uniref:S8 family serine peptidase n=1 Tax=Lonepinella sp. BR2474 TaxID=3434548 RepID=UPI003F6DB923
MDNYPFKQTLLAVMIGLSMTSTCYAEDAEELEEQEQIINPHSAIGLTEHISNQYSGLGVKLGVIDSGFMTEHPLFNQKKLHSLAFDTTDTEGNKKRFDPKDYPIETEEDEDGDEKIVYIMHGGQVAGIIGAKSVAQYGYEGGVAKEADIYLTTTEAQKISSEEDDDDNSNISPNNDSKLALLLGEEAEIKDYRHTLATAFAKQTENNPLAINNSWNEDPVEGDAQAVDTRYKVGIAQATDNELVNAIQSAVKKGSIIVFAAGNESKQQPGIMAALPRYLPALEHHYLSVVAVNDGENLADYSNHCGVSKNWCVAAPGSFTVLVTNGAEQHIQQPGLQMQEGTSFAAPVVTGALALVKQRFNYFTSSQVRDTLLTTATDLGETGIDDTFGWGLIDLSAAINGPAKLLQNETYTLSTNDTWLNDLTGEYQLTKNGPAALTLAGENNRLKAIVVNEGKLVLTGQTSVDHISNNAQLAISALTVNQGLNATSDSQLILNTKQAFTAEGTGTLINLNGILAVSNDLTQDVQSGETITDVLALKNGASYTGGFTQLISNDNLIAKGLRQDLYFKNERITLQANANQPFTDPQANSNGNNGLQLLNALRDTPIAWKKGIYNDWLQHAIEYHDLQHFHYAIGNVIYADSLDLLRNHTALGLTQTDKNLSHLQAHPTGHVNVWVERNGQRYKSDHFSSNATQFDQKTQFKTYSTGIGVAYKPSDKLFFTGHLNYHKSDIIKNNASATIKQHEAKMALRYMPATTGWFMDVMGNIAHVDYQQNRHFHSATLGMGSNKGWFIGGEWQTGYNLALSNWSLTPKVGLQATRLSMRALTEKGEWATSTSPYHQTDVNLSSGIELTHAFTLSNWKITPNLDVSYLRYLNGKRNVITSKLKDITFNSMSTVFSKNIWALGVGATLEKNNWLLSASVNQNTFKQGRATTWQAKFGFTF